MRGSHNKRSLNNKSTFQVCHEGLGTIDRNVYFTFWIVFGMYFVAMSLDMLEKTTTESP